MYRRISSAADGDLNRNSDSLYEKKVMSNRDFPIEILIKRSSNLRERQKIFSPHWHEHIELHYIISGTLEGTLDQTPYVVNRGDMAVFNGNVLHSGYCSSDYLIKQ